MTVKYHTYCDLDNKKCSFLLFLFENEIMMNIRNYRVPGMDALQMEDRKMEHQKMQYQYSPNVRR